MPEILNRIRRRRRIGGSDVTTTYNVHVGQMPSIDEVPLLDANGQPIELTKNPPLVKREKPKRGERGSVGIEASQPSGDKE